MFHLIPFKVKVSWGFLHLARPARPGDDGWGLFAVLRGTVWERALTVIDDDDLAHALRGYSDPILRKLGVRPEDFAKTVPKDQILCVQYQNSVCPLRTEKCYPCSAVPDCYEPPHLSGDGAQAALDVALAIQEGRQVVIPVKTRG